MKLSHLLIAGAAAVSFSAFGADEQKQDQQQPQAQSRQGAQSGQQGQQQMNQETVKQVQQKLSQSGHQLQVDGIMGPKTQAALKDYQQQKGLKATGRLDQQTMASLGVEEGASASVGSSAEPKEKSSGAAAGATGGASSEKSGEKAEKGEKKY